MCIVSRYWARIFLVHLCLFVKSVKIDKKLFVNEVLADIEDDFNDICVGIITKINLPLNARVIIKVS